MRVIFMGTPDFSVPALDALLDAGHEISAVYCQPPRPAGRGKKPRLTPVHARAQALGLTVRHPVNFRDPVDVADFAALAADIAVVVAYGLILPESILAAPKHGCLNIHASLLPRWRGAAPIHRAIMAGDKETGVAIMQMEKGLDTGPVLLSRKKQINPTDTTAILHDQLSSLGAEAIVQALGRLDALEPKPQTSEGVCYAEKIDKSEAEINWAADAVTIDRKIRGLSPFPGAWCQFNGGRLKLLASELTDEQGKPGEILDVENGLTIACETGAVRLLRVQRAGKSAVSWDDFLRGTDLRCGEILQ